MTSSTIEKIQSFGDFNQGWNFGEGVPFAPSILLKAMQLIKTAHALGFAETDAFPGLNGESNGNNLFGSGLLGIYN